MTFWDPDEEINLVSNKPAEKKVHASEARSAFGSTDFNINTSRNSSSSSDGFHIASNATTSPTATHIKATGSVFTPDNNNNNDLKSPKTVSASSSSGSSAAGVEERSKLLQSHQESVPSLPVPDLKETLDLYLKSLEGLVSAESWQRTKDNVDAFLTEKISPNDTESTGEKLQRLLKEHSQEAKPNWLEAFWDDTYLFGRDALPINVNYCFGFSPSPLQHTHTASTETQLNRASCLLHAMGSIYNEIRIGQWSLDFERKSPQCMSQYRRVFCTSRIPGENRDSIETYLAPGHMELTKDELASSTCHYETLAEPVRHVVVIARNRYYSLDIFDKDESDAAQGMIRLLSVEEIAQRMARILHTCTKEGASAGAPVGVLTTTHRTDWWRAREELKALGNEDILRSIQCAIAVVALDSRETESSEERARIFLHGPGTNRWFDRHSLIVTRNGDAGLNFEHAIGDGATTLRIADEMYRREKSLHSKGRALSREKSEEILKAACDPSTSSHGGISELRWKLDGHIDTLMRGAYTDYVQLIQSTETTTLDFDRFGGDYIKKSGNSPDAFVQLAFQLTHHRLYGRPSATYEAASTRTFSHGRTEVLRSCTRAATDFCQLSGEPIFSHRVNSQIPPQLTLLRNATEAHVGFMRRAKEGRGVDRHLLGLRLMSAKAGIETPAIFTDDNFKKSSHWGLSTSHCGSSALTLFGFGPVVPDGFGLGYMIKNDNISFVITSKYTHRYHSSTVFSTMLESSLLQMRAIVDADWDSRNKARPKAMTFSHPTTYNDIEFEPTRGFVYAHKQKRSLYDQGTQNSMSPTASFAHSSGESASY